MVAHGFRNPFRLAIRPGTNDLYVGDVGESAFEEINRIGEDRTQLDNSGWPCFEGPDRYPTSPGCRSAATSRRPRSSRPVVQVRPHRGGHLRGGVRQDTGSVSALAFAEDAAFPAGVEGGAGVRRLRAQLHLVPAAHRRRQPPTLATRRSSSRTPTGPVDLFTGNDGTLYYVEIGLGRLRDRRQDPPDHATTPAGRSPSWQVAEGPALRSGAARRHLRRRASRPTPTPPTSSATGGTSTVTAPSRPTPARTRPCDEDLRRTAPRTSW